MYKRQLPDSVEGALRQSAERERSPLAREVLEDLTRNFEEADRLQLPICQDTGMAVVFAEVGQELRICGGFEDAVNEGVRRGYLRGLLRLSVVADPLRRGNTGDNTPAILHTRLVPGDRLRPVSYTHLDVYKRQAWGMACARWSCSRA